MNLNLDMKERRAAIDPRALRDAFGGFATGVTVMTTVLPDGSPIGMTANSFNTVSLEPALILWSVRLDAASLEAFRANDHFAVNILSEEQKELCFQFARPSQDKFRGVAYRRGLGGAPLIEGAIARLQCRVWARYAGGDHEIYVGEVMNVEARDGEPLVFCRGAIRKLCPDERPS